MRRLLLACLLALASACTDEMAPRLAVSGLPFDDVDIEVKALGRLEPEEVAARARVPGIDGVLRLAPGSCEGACRWAEVSLYITNRSSERLAPPVVRMEGPPGRPDRPPLGLGAHQVDPGRAGRIRWLVELYPEEQTVDLRLSSSVFFEVEATPAPAPAAPPASGGDVEEAPEESGSGSVTTDVR